MSRVSPLHLGRRFVRALWPGPPRERDVEWVASILEPGELRLWRSLPNHDQRYTIRVAKLVEERLAGTEFAGQPRWLAAALLHDTGKLDAGLGVFGRSVATVMGAAAGPVCAPPCCAVANGSNAAPSVTLAAASMKRNV